MAANYSQHPDTPLPHRGQVVSSMDHRRVGKVTDVRVGSFLVTADDGKEIWLKRECVFTVVAEGVTLICGFDQVGDYEAIAPVN